MTTRRRLRLSASFQDRLAEFAKDARERAAKLLPGVERDDLLRKARQAEEAAHLDDWANSSGLQPPAPFTDAENAKRFRAIRLRRPDNWRRWRRQTTDVQR